MWETQACPRPRTCAVQDPASELQPSFFSNSSPVTVPRCLPLPLPLPLQPNPNPNHPLTHDLPVHGRHGFNFHPPSPSPPGSLVPTLRVRRHLTQTLEVAPGNHDSWSCSHTHSLVRHATGIGSVEAAHPNPVLLNNICRSVSPSIFKLPGFRFSSRRLVQASSESELPQVPA